MQIVKVRRVGNSNVISLPRSMEGAGYVPGASVVLDVLPDGEAVLIPATQVDAYVHAIGRRVIAKHRKALDLLEAYDRDRHANDESKRASG
jgi:antitoxin component of MazEF toxin-antitoxin module